jgi:hypothetical protein
VTKFSATITGAATFVGVTGALIPCYEGDSWDVQIVSGAGAATSNVRVALTINH